MERVPETQDRAKFSVMETYREQIDRIDDQILTLLNQRALLAVEIDALKQASYIHSDLQREDAIIARLMEQGNGPFRPQDIARIYLALFEATKGVQRDYRENNEVGHADPRV